MSSLFSATPMDAEENKNSKEASKKLAIKYQGSKRFYVTPSGREILDKRKVGPIYPNLFDVIRDGRYISTEDEDKGCNLEKMFLGTLYQKQGFAVRKYLNAIATSASNCSSLATPEERNLCQQFHSNPSCRGVKPIVFEVEPLTAGQSYLTLKKQTPFSCASKVQVILNDTYISKQSEEWSKIERDLIEKKREKYVTELKAKAPINKIRKAALVKNPSATQREIAFAVNDWVYSESKKASFNVPDSEIQSIVEKRYTPSSAMKNLISYGKTIGGSCAGKEKRYNSKVYAEASNIPAHEVLVFADYVDTSNKCICK
ncbi:MAG: hypothetical protein QNJ31_04270 [Candidatus Caenarcaniphilales bacterium]|nr:hypothetical protein [Candidatus Caenarcaniphilales bacterium]